MRQSDRPGKSGLSLDLKRRKSPCAKSSGRRSPGRAEELRTPVPPEEPEKLLRQPSVFADNFSVFDTATKVRYAGERVNVNFRAKKRIAPGMRGSPIHVNNSRNIVPPLHVSFTGFDPCPPLIRSPCLPLKAQGFMWQETIATGVLCKS